MFSNQGQFNQFQQQGFPQQGFQQQGFPQQSQPQQTQPVQHHHGNQAVNVSMELQEISEALDNAQKLKVQAETNLGHYQNQFKECNAELQQLGINPENAKAELEKLKEEIKQTVQELKELMPHSLIEDLKNELNKPIEVEIDLPDEDIIF